MTDEDAIRKVVADWLDASAAGEADRLRDLMDEDIVFLTAGQPPMRGREGFVEGFREFAKTCRVEGVSDIQEVQIAGDLAYCWNHLSVTMVPLDGGPAKIRAGHVLSVMRRGSDGRWRLFRDANLM